MNLGDRKGLGDLYFFHWIVKFTQADRLEALSRGIRPKTEGEKGDFRPLTEKTGAHPPSSVASEFKAGWSGKSEITDGWVRIFFEHTTPQERIEFYEKDALPQMLKKIYVDLMKRVQIHGPEGNITEGEADEIVRRAGGGVRRRNSRRRRTRLFQNNRYEPQCPFCGNWHRVNSLLWHPKKTEN